MSELVDQTVGAQGWRGRDLEEAVAYFRELGSALSALVEMSDAQTLSNAWDRRYRRASSEPFMSPPLSSVELALDAVQRIAELVDAHDRDESCTLDAEQVLERIGQALLPVRATLAERPTTRRSDLQRLMRAFVHELAERLTASELQELAGEAAVAWREKSVEENANARHLSLVLVLTELERAGEAVTVLSLAARLSSTESEVRRLVAELYRRGKVRVAGDFVSLEHSD